MIWQNVSDGIGNAHHRNVAGMTFLEKASVAILDIIGVEVRIPGYVTSNYWIEELDMARGTPDRENDGGDEDAAS